MANYFSRLYNMKRDASGGHERPHKPALLLAVLDLADSGEIRDNRIPLNDALISRFREYFAVVARGNDQPNIHLPYFHLCGDGFWHLQPNVGRGPVYVPGEVSAPKSVAQLQREAAFATLDPELWQLVADPANREEIREALIARYFPDQAKQLFALSHKSAPESDRALNDEPESTPRSAAFRRLICELYDYQCAACGLRIRLEDDVTFIDAAHLIPFAESHNDHPSNGLALCKNHHWAMDSRLIALDLENHWRVSPTLHAFRSEGEKDLLTLRDREVVRMPKEADFRPGEANRLYRLDRLRGASPR